MPAGQTPSRHSFCRQSPVHITSLTASPNTCLFVRFTQSPSSLQGTFYFFKHAASSSATRQYSRKVARRESCCCWTTSAVPSANSPFSPVHPSPRLSSFDRQHSQSEWMLLAKTVLRDRRVWIKQCRLIHCPHPSKCFFQRLCCSYKLLWSTSSLP